MEIIPKIKLGQKINLIQVTGKATISGYVSLDLHFHTEEGPVRMNVEAYVVKGMSTPFILGNDFAAQYSISVLRRDGESELELGESGRRIKVETSISLPFLDDEGHTFKIRYLRTSPGLSSKKGTHQKNQKFKHKTKFRSTDRNI